MLSCLRNLYVHSWAHDGSTLHRMQLAELLAMPGKRGCLLGARRAPPRVVDRVKRQTLTNQIDETRRSVFPFLFLIVTRIVFGLRHLSLLLVLIPTPWV